MRYTLSSYTLSRKSHSVWRGSYEITKWAVIDEKTGVKVKSGLSLRKAQDMLYRLNTLEERRVSNGRFT